MVLEEFFGIHWAVPTVEESLIFFFAFEVNNTTSLQKLRKHTGKKIVHNWKAEGTDLYISCFLGLLDEQADVPVNLSQPVKDASSYPRVF